jgi:prepilin-type N-terminal cleavage/methylation domain-containing protein
MRKIFCRQHKKINKKGYTLVELLVCVAIMAVISLMLGQIVASTTNAYRRSSAMTQIQESSQDLYVQLSNIVRNSQGLTVTKLENGRIVFDSVNYEGKIIKLIYVPDTTNGDKLGRIYVDFDHKATLNAAGATEYDITMVDGSVYTPFLITEYVRSFTVELDKYNAKDEEGNVVEKTQDKTLNFTLEMEKNGKEYIRDYKASLRSGGPGGSDLTINMVDFTVTTPDGDDD